MKTATHELRNLHFVFYVLQPQKRARARVKNRFALRVLCCTVCVMALFGGNSRRAGVIKIGGRRGQEGQKTLRPSVLLILQEILRVTTALRCLVKDPKESCKAQRRAERSGVLSSTHIRTPSTGTWGRSLRKVNQKPGTASFESSLSLVPPHSTNGPSLMHCRLSF